MFWPRTRATPRVLRAPSFGGQASSAKHGQALHATESHHAFDRNLDLIQSRLARTPPAAAVASVPAAYRLRAGFEAQATGRLRASPDHPGWALVPGACPPAGGASGEAQATPYRKCAKRTVHTHTLERRTGRHTRGEKRRGKGAEAEVEAKAVAVVRTQTQGAGRYTEPKKTGESARARDLEVKSSQLVTQHRGQGGRLSVWKIRGPESHWTNAVTRNTGGCVHQPPKYNLFVVRAWKL